MCLNLLKCVFPRRDLAVTQWFKKKKKTSILEKMFSSTLQFHVFQRNTYFWCLHLHFQIMVKRGYHFWAIKNMANNNQEMLFFFSCVCKKKENYFKKTLCFVLEHFPAIQIDKIGDWPWPVYLMATLFYMYFLWDTGHSNRYSLSSSRVRETDLQEQ